MDVEYEILEVENKMCLNKSEYIWIKGHQKMSEEENNLYIRLNNRADTLATLARTEVERGQMVPARGFFFESMTAAVEIEDEIIHNDLKNKTRFIVLPAAQY